MTEIKKAAVKGWCYNCLLGTLVVILTAIAVFCVLRQLDHAGVIN